MLISIVEQLVNSMIRENPKRLDNFFRSGAWN